MKFIKNLWDKLTGKAAYNDWRKRQDEANDELLDIIDDWPEPPAEKLVKVVKE